MLARPKCVPLAPSGFAFLRLTMLTNKRLWYTMAAYQRETSSRQIMEPLTAPRPRPGRLWKKIFLTFGGTLLGLSLAVFLAFFVFYLWQYKYGSAAGILRTKRELGSAKFTLAVSSASAAPKAPEDPAKFIRPRNAVIGNSNSPLIILAFVDFQCPYSQVGHNLFKNIIDTYGSAAKVVVKHLPLPTIHPQAMSAALASACAEEQGKFWEYYDALFTSGKLDDSDLKSQAVALGLDETKFNGCLKTAKYRADIEADMLDAAALGVRGTPTYFVGSEVVEGVVERARWDQAVLTSLQR